LKIDSIESTLFVTPTIQAGPLTGVTIVRDSNLVGNAITYTVGFTTTNAFTETNGIFLSFAPPSGFLFEGSSLSCTFNTVDATTGCAATYNAVSYGNEVSILRVPMS
jgi:hypothetical protein